MSGDDTARARPARAVPRGAGGDAGHELALRPPPLSGDLPELLEALSASLAERGAAPVAGRAPVDVERRLLDAGVAPLPDLIVWWAAHDGAPGEVADSWRLLGLDEALGLREEYRRNYSDAGAPDRWPTGWVPVLAFAGAAVLCADGETGAVHVEDDGFPEPSPPQFDSLADLVGTLLRAQGLGASAAAHDPELRRLWWW